MIPSVGLSLILLGMALVALAQLGMAIHAFSGNPIKGVLCLVVPLYIIVHAKKSQTGRRLLAAWYAGLAVLVVGGIISS